MPHMAALNTTSLISQPRHSSCSNSSSSSSKGKTSKTPSQCGRLCDNIIMMCTLPHCTDVAVRTPPQQHGARPSKIQCLCARVVHDVLHNGCLNWLQKHALQESASRCLVSIAHDMRMPTVLSSGGSITRNDITAPNSVSLSPHLELKLIQEPLLPPGPLPHWDVGRGHR
jgi:hypothetical protein